MKTLNSSGLFQCKFVSDLFEYSTKKHDCSSKNFIKAYVYSSVRSRISSKNFIFESIDVAAAYEMIKNEEKLTKGKEIYPSYVMAWIGYIFMYFELSTGIPQTTLYKNIKPEELYGLYEAYHSLDNELAIKRIAEAKNININLNDAKLMQQINML